MRLEQRQSIAVNIALVTICLFGLVFGCGVVDAAEPVYGTIVAIHDVDTMTVRTEDFPADDDRDDLISVRQFGVDGPELKQAYGLDAVKFARDVAEGQRCKLELKGRSWERYVANVFVIEKGVKQSRNKAVARYIDYGLLITREGYAWQDTRYSKSKIVAEAQAHAKFEKRGLWESRNPVAPWVWRAEQKRLKKMGIVWDATPAALERLSDIAGTPITAPGEKIRGKQKAPQPDPRITDPPPGRVMLSSFGKQAALLCSRCRCPRCECEHCLCDSVADRR